MKKTILSSLTFLLLSQLSIAQNSKGFYLVPTVEFGLSGNHQANISGYEFDKASKQIIKADIGYMFNKNVGLFTGLGLGLYSADLRSSDHYWYMSQHLVQLENPFYFRYTTSLKQKVNFFGNAGVQMSYKLHGSTSQINRDGNAGQNFDNTSLYSNVIISPFVNLGITFKLKNSWFDLGTFCSYAVNDTYNSKYLMPGDPYRAKMWTAGLKFAYGFSLQKKQGHFGGDLKE